MEMIRILFLIGLESKDSFDKGTFYRMLTLTNFPLMQT